MGALMVQGCSSWAGKSLLTTALCRWFARQGLSVAPFKGQNMSNNARVVAGGEIGVAQWLQARAAGVEPDVRMNPVLLKPEPGGSQVIRLGRVDHQLSRRAWQDRSAALWPTIESALASLLERFDLVMIEGAGSPAEINLAAHDVTNMRVADRADASVLLVVDINRGGAFAHLYGTWSLLPDRHRDRIAGFVLNRFRGDARLLAPGPDQLERLTGVPTIGVVPMLSHDLPDEDGAALHAPPTGGRPRVAVVRYPSASNLDELTLLEQVADVRWITTASHLTDLDMVILPGSKHVAADLAWLRVTSVADAVCRAATTGVRVLGVCGGMQLLGTALHDPSHLDGDGDALGLLPISTTFEPDKLQRRAHVVLPELPAAWAALTGRAVSGYDIRHGRSTAAGHAVHALPDGHGWAAGSVLGVAFHGLLEDPGVLEALFGARPARGLDQTLDRLADAVDAYVDTERLRHLARVGRRSGGGRRPSRLTRSDVAAACTTAAHQAKAPT